MKNLFIEYYYNMLKTVAKIQLLASTHKFYCYNQLVEELEEVIKEIQSDITFILTNDVFLYYIYHSNIDIRNMMQIIEINQFTNETDILELYYNFLNISKELEEEVVLYQTENKEMIK